MSVITIHAAIIEWPSELADADPRLVLALDDNDLSVKIAEELRSMAEMLTDPQWRNAIANADGAPWPELLEMLEETEYSSPYVSTYEREIAT